MFKKTVELSIEAYTNVYWARFVVNKRLNPVYYTLLGVNLVTWKSKKQTVMARSSANTELRAMTHGICELLWLKILLEEIRIKWQGPMKLHCDNKFAFNIAHKLDSGLICTPYVSTNRQLVDILSKIQKLWRTICHSNIFYTTTFWL